MQKEVNIYDIQYFIKNNKVYFKSKEKIGTLNFNYDYNYDDIEDKILSYDEKYKNIYDKMQILRWFCWNWIIFYDGGRVRSVRRYIIRIG